MKFRSALLSVALLLTGVLVLLPTPASALTDLEGGFTYTGSSASPYSTISDERGNQYFGGAWSCGITPNSGVPAATITPADTSTLPATCSNRNGATADYLYINGDGNDLSIIVIEGASSRALYGLDPDQGVPTGYFVSYRAGSSTINELSRFVSINAATVAPIDNVFEDISYHSGIYQFLDDSFETIVDQDRGIRFEKIDGCVDTGRTSDTYGQILQEGDSNCSSATYYVYQSGPNLAYLEFNSAVSNSTLASLPDPSFGSFASGGPQVIIESARINKAAFFAGQAISDFDSKCVQAIGVLNWILCPMINFAIDNVAVPIQDFILNILETDSLLTAPATNNNSHYIYSAWAQFRTIANALLALAFMFLIYMMLFSQSGNFSIQRMLPRLVVITIMIQISYFVAAVIIDIGNVSAEGIANIFNYVRDQAVIETALNSGGSALDSAIPESTRFLSASQESRGVGAGFGVILAIFGFYMWTFFIPGVIFFFAIGLLVAILGVMLALTLRQLGIVVLVVLSPIAFLFGLFPATEKWMREWFDNLGKLVLVYPLIALVFGAGSLLSFMALGQDTTSGPNTLIASSIGLIILFTIPALLAAAGKIFSRFTTVITGMSKQAKTGLQGNPQDPLSWRSNVQWDRAQKQYQFYERAGKVAPVTRRFLRPSWKAAKIFADGAQRMQGVVSATHPMNLRRLYWGNKPFKSLAGYANWKNEFIKSAKPFNHEISNITKSTPMLYSTIDAALQDTGFLFDRGLNYTYGIGRMFKDKEIDRGTAELMWQAYHARVKSQGHRPFFGFSNPDLLLDYNFDGAADLGGKWFAQNLDQISNQQERQAIFGARQSSLEDFGNAGTEREAGTSFRYVARWLNDDTFLNEMMSQTNNQRNINAIDTLKRKADTMNMALNDPSKRAELIARMQQMGGDDDDGARVGGYGQSGQGIRHMEEFVKAANHAYDYMRSRGVNFTDEINDFNF